MSSNDSESKRSSKPVFPYAVLPEKRPSLFEQPRVRAMVLVLAVVAVAIAGLLLLG